MALSWARLVAEACDASAGEFRFTYPLDLPIKDKILAVVQKVYGGKDVQYSEQAEATYAELRRWGLETCRSAWRKRSTP